MSAKFGPVMVKFNQSGNHCPDFRRYNNGDSVLHYMYVMYEDNQMLMKLTDKEIDGGVGTESSIGSAASPTGALGRPAVAARTNTLSKRLSRERNEALSSMAESSAMMADSSRRRAATKTVDVFPASLSAARKADSSNVVIQAMEEQLLKCINECSTGPPRKRVRDDAAAERGGGDGGGTATGVHDAGGDTASREGSVRGGGGTESDHEHQRPAGGSGAGSGSGYGDDYDSVGATLDDETDSLLGGGVCGDAAVLAGAQGVLLMRASWMTRSF